MVDTFSLLLQNNGLKEQQPCSHLQAGLVGVPVLSVLIFPTAAKDL